MNNLGLYIKDALVGRDEIYLPKIGTFVKERIPAYFDELKANFIPPSLNVTLRKERTTDQSFIQFLIEKENIDRNEAQSKLEQILKTVETDFEEKGEIYLEGFGILKKKNNGYDFFYVQQDNVFKEYEPIAEAEILEPVQIKEPEEIAVAPIASPVIENVLAAETEIETTSSKRWLWPVIGTAVCVVIAAFLFLKPASDSEISKGDETAINNPVDSQKSAAILPTPIDSIQESVNLSVQDTLETENLAASLSDEKSGPTIIKESKGRFEIIIAAFNTMKEAEEYVSKTNAKGYQVYILKNNKPSNLNKISYSSFQNEQDAAVALAKVRKELTPDAWIFENKNIKINH